MDTSLVIAGIACVAGAIVGGGLSAFGISVPIVSSMRRQLVLACFGALLLLLGLVPSSPHLFHPARPQPTSSPSHVFGPVKRSLVHEPDTLPRWFAAGVVLRDFDASVTFVNPYSAGEHKWDIDLEFRVNLDQLYRLGVVSDGTWFLSYFAGTTWKYISGAQTKLLHLGEGDTNTLRVIGVGERGCAYMNGSYLGDLVLKQSNESGDISVLIGSNKEYKRAGAVTEFRDFTIDRVLTAQCP